MTRRDPTVALRHMLDHTREAVELAQHRTRQELADDRSLQLSIARLLEIVGEAANRVPNEIRLRHPDIPWTAIIGLRNRLIHAYDTVDYDVVWSAI